MSDIPQDRRLDIDEQVARIELAQACAMPKAYIVALAFGAVGGVLGMATFLSSLGKCR